MDELREKCNDLYNLIQNLEMTIKETNLKEVKEDLQSILDWVKDEFEDLDKELEEIELEEVRKELRETEIEYREMVGF